MSIDSASQNAVVDQQTDTDFKIFYKIASRISEGLMVQVLDATEIDYSFFSKIAANMFADQDNRQFPVDTRENTILSRLYFDAQADQFSEKTAADIQARLDTFLELHNCSG